MYCAMKNISGPDQLLQVSMYAKNVKKYKKGVVSHGVSDTEKIEL